MLESIKRVEAEFAATVTTALDNGFRMFIDENRGSSTASVQFWVATGSVHEGDSLGCGLSHFLEHMIFQGSAEFAKDEIAAVVHRHGGEINAATSFGYTVFHADVASPGVPDTINLLGDMIRNPLLPAERFADEKQVILRERAMFLDNPTRYLQEKAWNTVFQRHPVRHPVIGYADKIVEVERERMVDYHRRRYSPHRCFLVVSGDVDAAAVIRAAEDKMGDWKLGELGEPFIAVEPPQTEPREADYVFEDPLARFAVVYHAPPLGDPRLPALEILSGIVGGGAGSRLYRRLKTERDLILGIDAFQHSTREFSLIGACGACQPGKLDETIENIEEVMRVAVESGVEAGEIERVKLQMAMSRVCFLEGNHGRAAKIAEAVLADRSPAAAADHLRHLAAVGIEDVQKAAAEFIDGKNQSVVTVAPERRPPRKSRSAVEFEKSGPKLSVSPEGVRILCCPDNKLPLVHIAIVMPGGQIMERAENCGISHVLAAQLATETADIDERELADRLDDNSISLDVSAGKNTFCVRLFCFKDKIDQALAIAESIIGKPWFDGPAFERNRSDTLEMVRTRSMHSSIVASQAALKLLFGAHPYGLPGYGSEESVSNLTAGQLTEFHQGVHLDAVKTIISVAGDVDYTQGLDLGSRLAAAPRWNGEGAPLPLEPMFGAGETSSTIKLPRRQTAIQVSLPGCANNNPDQEALELFNIAMNGISTRFFNAIREDLGMAYHAGASIVSGLHPGHVSFKASVEAGNTDKTIAVMKREIDCLSDNGLKQDEFETAKARMLFHLAEQSAHLGELAFHRAISEFYGQGFDRIDRKPDEVRAIGFDAANEIVKRYTGAPTRAIGVAAGN